MRIGVTGATGQLGRLVVEQLLTRHPAEEIVAIVRDPAKAADLAAAGVGVRVADYDDRAALEAAFTGLDRLLLISSSEVGRRVQQHKNVIDAAKAAGVKHVVYTSAPKATTSRLVVAPEHKATEEYLIASGIPYTILRNNWYTENYSQAIRTAAETGELVAAAGAGRVASATRADLAEAAAVVLTSEGHEGKVYELGAEKAWDYYELAATIAEITGRPCVYKPIEPEELVARLKAAGMDEQAAQSVAAVDAGIAEGGLAVATDDLAKLLGRPPTPLREAVRRLLG